MSCLSNLDKIILRYPAWQTLGTNIRRLDNSTDTEPEAVIDRAKAMFETVSKTLLVRVGENAQVLESLDVVALRQSLLTHLHLPPADEKIIKNFIDILVQSRNSQGIIGHGRDLQRESEIRSGVDKVRNEFIICMLDACLCLLIDTIESRNEITEEVETDTYTSNENYNSLVDADEVDIEIRGVPYKKSELLFYTDRQSYLEGLRDFENEASDERR
jgi:hypothetical protein